ncbi:uncharacterized protein LOC134207519 [Armigeres subalbatus]|uniref:uncharacterized protein LOC134207519 n=1 Tax=Armigeres subalbatus TaxID=124917 RepID=UPI002ED0F47E
MGFQPTESDPCLYVRRENGSAAYILIYVDDMIIVTQTMEEFKTILKTLQEHFTVADLGDIRHFLGMEIENSPSGYKLNQETYIRRLTERFGMELAKPSKIPLDPGYLQKKEEMDQLPNNHDYMSLIGGLLYVAVHTRPDIAVSTSILAQKSSCPNSHDWTEAKRVLRYLYTTSNNKLHLGTSNEGLQMFDDADWAGDSHDRKSNSGVLIMFGGGLISWGSRSQSCVALSSTEADFVALAEGCQDTIIEGFVVNRSTQQFTEEQLVHLNDGLGYAVIQKSDMEQIMDMETAISRNIEQQDQNTARNIVANAIKEGQHGATNHDERRILKEKHESGQRQRRKSTEDHIGI